jgi:hypothetical protein
MLTSLFVGLEGQLQLAGGLLIPVMQSQVCPGPGAGELSIPKVRPLRGLWLASSSVSPSAW